MTINPDIKNSLLRPIQVQTADVVVLDSLTQFVANSGIKIGDKLPAERELTERLKVSRSTIREALKRWETLGIIERRKGSGTFLRSSLSGCDNFLSLKIKNDAENMLHSLEIRRVLETEACALAALRATDEEIAYMELCLKEVERVHNLYGAAGNQDWEFHCSIYRATGNPIFEQLLDAMHENFHAFFDAPPDLGFSSRSFQLHIELFEAIKSRDPELAKEKNQEILDITQADLKTILSNKKINWKK